MRSLKGISPDYPRIPHLDSSISQMTHDDIVLDRDIQFPFNGYYQEKVDAANLGISWYNNGPILRNRKFILKKGYSKIRTPAKAQFKSAWNWLHEHEDDIKEISKLYQTEVTIYGEWMLAQHSLHYNRLPDLFLAYDIFSVQDKQFLSPPIVGELLSQTRIHYIPSIEFEFQSMSQIEGLSEMDSQYRDGKAEGIVIKTIDGRFVTDYFKVINRHFERCEDFNERGLVKNKLM